MRGRLLALAVAAIMGVLAPGGVPAAAGPQATDGGSPGLPSLTWPNADLWVDMRSKFGIVSVGTGATPFIPPMWSYVSLWGNSDSGEWFDHGCKSYSDAFCQGLAREGNAHWAFGLVAPACQVAAPRQQCLESLTLVTASGERTVARRTGAVPGPTVSANRAIGLPEGSTASLFDNPFTDDTADGFLVSLSGELAADYRTGLPDPRLWGDADTPFGPKKGFQLSVIAYTSVPGDYAPARWHPGQRQVAEDRPAACVFVAQGHCGWRTNFAADLAFEVAFRQLRYSTADSDWVGARLSNASIKQEGLGRGMERIIIAGKPVDVPQVLATTDKDSAPPEMLDLWRRANRCDTLPAERNCWSGLRALTLDDPLSTELLLAFKDAAADRSPMSLPSWSAWTESAQSITAADPLLQRRCSSLRDGRIIGLVSTNATLYAPGPPRLVKGVLEYKVAGLHYLADASVFRGTYDLVMDGEYIRCLYRLTGAPISATIQITAADGTDEQVATAAVRERDGLLSLRATGFTFSNPVISVRIAGQKAKPTTIRCKKGNEVKKVTGISPLCPKGWKRI